MSIQYVHMPVKTKKWQKTKKHKNKPSTEQATNSMHKIKQQKKKTVAGQKKTHYIHISIKKKTKKLKTNRATNNEQQTACTKRSSKRKKTVAGQKKAVAATENSSHSKKQKLQHNTVCT